MKIVFMGTPEFSVKTLTMLIEKHEVVGVFTQPDKPKGRGQKLGYSPVKEEAMKHNVKVFQPIKLRKDREAIEELKRLKPDAIIVVAYGQLLPKEILDIPRYGCINIHASLLPILRGAAPINWAVIEGHKKTGITTMLMNEGIDTGDMLLKSEVEISEDNTYEEIHDKLMIVGAELLIETLDKLSRDEIIPEKQLDELSTYAPMLTKELGHIDWKKTSQEIYNLIRGVTPWPSAYSYYKGNMIKLWKVENLKSGVHAKPGEIINLTKKGIEVACKEGSILIKEVQEFGGKRMDAASYINGHDIKVGIELE